MSVFNKFVKVIAIEDSPIVNSLQFGKGVQAYKKGDIFEVMSSFTDQIIVWHPKIGSTMALDSKNFELLSEFRNKKIDSIL
jgi:hypothetical protein